MTGASSSVICFLHRCFVKDNHSNFLLVSCLLFLFCSTGLVDAAPHRSKNRGRDGPQLVYDQKQTGDYNIQLHLKDFQIIALLGDDALGDYDYNYDYADFTIKPSGPSSTTTTPKPSSTTQQSTTTIKLSPSTTYLSSNSKPGASNNKPIELSAPETPSQNANPKPSSNATSNIHPYPIEIVMLKPNKEPEHSEENKIKETQKPSEDSENNNNSVASESSLNEISSSTLTSTPQSSVPPSTSTLPSKSSSSTPEAMTPGKIKVQILEIPSTTVGGAIPVGIVPGEDVQADTNGGILNGELASYRKCATGFARDKKGRCRRVRRPGVTPQLPFGFGRIASNLATRLRLPLQDSPIHGPISPEN